MISKLLCDQFDNDFEVLYNVRYMIQIVSITEARKNLAKLVQQVKDSKKPIVVVQDSTPSIVLYPYDEAFENEKKKQELFQIRFSKLLDEGKVLGNAYLKEKKISSPLSEEDAYDLIKNG